MLQLLVKTSLSFVDIKQKGVYPVLVWNEAEFMTIIRKMEKIHCY